MHREIIRYTIFLLLGVRGGHATETGMRPLRQSTVSPNHWHHFEELDLFHLNTDLDTLYQSHRDAGYFSIKRPGVKINSASDESIFKVRLCSNGIISLNDVNITSLHPETYHLKAPSFLPLRTDAEIDFALRYDRDLFLLAPSAAAKKRKLEEKLRDLNHCNHHGNKNTPWFITESHPERPSFSLTVSTATSAVKLEDRSGEFIDVHILNVVLSNKLTYVDGDDISGSFDILYSMEPELKIWYISAPVTRTPNDNPGIITMKPTCTKTDPITHIQDYFSGAARHYKKLRLDSRSPKYLTLVDLGLWALFWVIWVLLVAFLAYHIGCWIYWIESLWRVPKMKLHRRLKAGEEDFVAVRSSYFEVSSHRGQEFKKPLECNFR